MHLAANRWYVVLSADELARGRALGVRRFGHELVLWRDAQGVARAALDRCPHRLARLSPGRVVDGCIECPFHGFRFDGSGACTRIPAHPARPISRALVLDALPMREEHEFLWAWTGPEPAPDAPVPFFDFEGCSWRGSQMIVAVANHYSRAIENQLDFTHLPFVHRTTIGRLVDEAMEVLTEVEGDWIRAWLAAGDGVMIEMLAPCIWRNPTGPTYQFLAFVPIDEGHMQYYVRTYQRLLSAPGLDWLLGRLSLFLNKLVIHQDTPVVESQPVGETRLGLGEVLVPSDGPIIAYRRWREEHRAAFELGR